jgi:hypothetical protein
MKFGHVEFDDSFFSSSSRHYWRVSIKFVSGYSASWRMQRSETSFQTFEASLLNHSKPSGCYTYHQFKILKVLLLPTDRA